jgi:hypothetical protein
MLVISAGSLPGRLSGTGQVGIMGSIGSSCMGQRQAKGFLKKPTARRAGELLKMSRNWLRILIALLGYLHIEGYLLTLGLVNSPVCDRSK